METTSFAEELLATAESLDPSTFRSLQEHVPEEWIGEALAASGVATLRRRRLPAESVVWLVLGIALYRDRPIEEVVDKLDLALPGAGPVARSSISQARARVGCEPIRWLFKTSASRWASESLRDELWHGLTVLAIDGSVLRVPDSEENRGRFGGQSNQVGASAYPLVRVVALMLARTRVLLDASVGGYQSTNEHDEAVGLMDSVPDFSVVIADRNFQGANLLIPLTTKGKERHWLRRAKSNNRWTVVEQRAPGDAIVEMKVSPKSHDTTPDLPEKWRMRAIEYTVAGEKRVMLTSMMDAKYPADEIVALYRERWEIEQGYDELKTEVLAREETIRSRTPVAVEQEIWGILLGYNLVRVEMQRIAAATKVSPRRISFVFALMQIRDEFLWSAITRSPGGIPKKLEALRGRITRFLLPPRRTERAYPRTVKSTSGYPRRRRPAAK